MSRVDTALREQMTRFLDDELSAADFRRWFLPLVWDAAQKNYLQSPLARRVELRLAEYSCGHWTEEDLKTLFARELPVTAGWGERLVVALHGVLLSGEPADLPVAPRHVSLTAS